MKAAIEDDSEEDNMGLYSDETDVEDSFAEGETTLIDLENHVPQPDTPISLIKVHQGFGLRFCFEAVSQTSSERLDLKCSA